MSMTDDEVDDDDDGDAPRAGEIADRMCAGERKEGS